MFKRLLWPLLGITLLTQLSCSSSIDSGAKQSSDITTVNKAINDAHIEIFMKSTLPSGNDYPTGEIQDLLPGQTLPKSLITSLPGSRQLPIAVEFNVFIRSYRVYSTFDNGDYFFEAPILGPVVELNSISTALTQFMRYSFDKTFKITRTQWESYLKSIEVVCPDCSQKTVTQVLSFLTFNPSIWNGIKSSVLTANPGVSEIPLALPKVRLVWASSAIQESSTDTFAWALAKEGEASNYHVGLWDMSNSTQRIVPKSWENFQESTLLETIPDQSVYTYTFAYAGTHESRNHTIKTHFSYGGQNYDYIFPTLVNFSNRPPQWDIDGLTLTLTANKRNTIWLKDLPQTPIDPDNDALTLTWVTSQIPNFLLNKDSNGWFFDWTPSQSPDTPNQVGDHQAAFQISDGNGGTKIVYITFKVIADSLPQFDSTMQTTYNVDEGQEIEIDIPTKDVDGDAVVVTSPDIDILTPLAVSPFATQTPAEFSSAITVDPTSPSGPLGSEVYKFKFKPSYRQVIGITQGYVKFKFSINYDTNRNPKLRNLATPPSMEVMVYVKNIEDPPQWSHEVQSRTDPLIAPENSLFTWNDGTSSETIGYAVSTDSITYDITPVNSTDYKCTWDPNPADSVMVMGIHANTQNMMVNGTTHDVPIISGTPSYWSDRNCQYYVTATTSFGLKARGAIFTIETSDVDRPPQLVAPGSTVSATDQGNDAFLEGQSYQIDLTTMITDPDVQDSLSTDHLQYTFRVDVDNTPADATELWRVNRLVAALNNGVDYKTQTTSFIPDFDMGSDAGKIYYLEVTAVDLAGAAVEDASHNILYQKLTVKIVNQPAKMKLTLNDATAEAQRKIVVSENQALGLVFHVTPFFKTLADGVTPELTDGSGNPVYESIDQYDYQLTWDLIGLDTSFTPVDVTTGAAGIVQDLGFTLDLGNNFNAGNDINSDKKFYILNLHLTSTSLATPIDVVFSYTVEVDNVNRVSTGLTINNSTSAVTVTYSPNTINLPLKLIDPDIAPPVVNDTPNFTIPFGSLGTFSTATGTTPWTFTFPTCIKAKAGSTITKSITIKGDDGRGGGTISKSVTMTVNNAQRTLPCSF